MLCCLIAACNGTQTGDLKLPPTYIEIPHADLVFEEFAPEIPADLEIPGCSLADLPPFGWKEVDSGLVDIRTPEDYVAQTESLYQEGFRDYLQNRAEFPDTYQSTPELTYAEFLATCDVFPEVDFSQHSILGYHATGTGCAVTFEKHVYRDDSDRKIFYQLTPIEEGTCEITVHDRNLILVASIPSDYTVDFSKSNRTR